MIHQSTPGHISRKDKNSNSKRYRHPKVHNSTTYNSKTWKECKCSLTDERCVCVCTHNIPQWNITQPLKEQNNAICSNKDGSNYYHTKSDKLSYDITYKWNLKNDTNELIYKTEIDLQTQKANLRLSKRKGRKG